MALSIVSSFLWVDLYLMHTEEMKMGYKKALITGAAKGIGRQIAISMAKAGYDIAVNYRSDEKAAMEVCRIAQESGVEAFPVYADMSVLAGYPLHV